MTAIHQLVAGFSNGDAISNEAIALRGIFRSWGRASDIFSESKRILPELRQEARDIGGCRDSVMPDDIALLHLSIGSPVNDVFASLPCRKAILYHNITPARFFTAIQRQVARLLEAGQKQVRSLAGTAEVTIAVSRYNADELTQLGYRNVKVLPIVFDRDALQVRPDRRTMLDFDDGKANILFVGRCAPNKKIEDLLLAFSCFQRAVVRDSRLILVGSHSGLERYYHILRIMARDLHVKNVLFTGAISPARLAAAYKSADVFLCMSEHEGFCVPIIESMCHDVPVMAYAAAAVPETLDGAGILFREKKFDMVAEMMGRLVNDDTFRTAVLEQQRSRVEKYFRRDVEAELRECLAPLLA